MVVVHGASRAFNRLGVLGDHYVKTGIFEPRWTEYAHMIGGTWSMDPPVTAHGKRHVFEISQFAPDDEVEQLLIRHVFIPKNGRRPSSETQIVAGHDSGRLRNCSTM